jgi:autotransporter-associated beta strand protein
VALAYGTTDQTRLLTLGGTNTGANTFSKVIADNGSGATSLTKAGAGRWVLGGTNTYTGATTVNAGTLLINGSTSSTSLVTVGVNGTLGGTGTVGGDTTISGTHNPGNSPGIQTFTGNLSYVDAGIPDPTVNWELASNLTTVGINPTANFDQVIVGGNLDFTDITTINLSFNGAGSTVLWANVLWDANQSWLLYDVAGTTTNFANLNLNTINWLDSGGNLFSTTGGSFSLGQSGEDVVLNYAVVPEPNAAALLGGFGMLALLRRRR